MANAMNTLVQSSARPSFTQVISSANYQTMLSNAIQDDEVRRRFVTAIVSAVSSNEKLAACTPKSIISAGLKCISLGFMPGGDLGDAYLIPYGQTATLQLGYKGLVRLAQRSGQCKTINMGMVQRGQTVKIDQITGDLEIIGEPESPDAPAIGYFAFLRLKGSGFEKAEYMTKEQAIAHARRYAKTSFDADKYQQFMTYEQTGEGMTQKEYEALGEGVYYSNFDQMAMKNVLRRLLLRWAPMSIEDQQTLEEDENGPKQDGIMEIDMDITGENGKPVDMAAATAPVEAENAPANKQPAKKQVKKAPAAEAEDDFFN